ncbi:MAG: hypothetical protein CMA34_06270 [Euryarchaeota archaeon]|nr:hypothetical protein [Euryarchaeota archaeon]
MSELEHPAPERKLHAVLGFSKVILANAILNGKWSEVVLYSSSKESAISTKNRIKKLHNKLKKQHKFPIIKIIEIPKIDEHKSIIQMFIELNDKLKTESKVNTQDVLLYSGTVAHIIQMIKSLDFKSILISEDGKLKIKGRYEESWEMMHLTVTDYLILHGLRYKEKQKKFITEDNEEIICKRLEEITVEQKDYGKIRFKWASLPSSNAQRIFMYQVLKLRESLGTQTMKHTIDDDLINKWLKNMEFPDTWEEEE